MAPNERSGACTATPRARPRGPLHSDIWKDLLCLWAREVGLMLSPAKIVFSFFETTVSWFTWCLLWRRDAEKQRWLAFSM